ncbi:MAG TPA: dihydroxy-acid dehydratase [Acidimicrobiales bacterium]|nr:dihydroxy-acid dehydratase [Acidimicrobiales bacterium]
MLRSDRWIVGDDEVALEHRIALRSAGAQVDASGGRPVIGIADTSSDLNPCNLPLRELISPLRAGIEEAGGVPAVFPVMSLGEDLMKPTAMLYRSLVAMEIEETLRANPLDGVVLLANCDKSVPAALMGAASAGLPALLVTGGARPPCSFRGRRLGTGTDLWRMWDERRAGRLDDTAWQELESCLSEGRGACNTMGTASTMAILAEVLGFAMPGSSTVPSGDLRGAGLAHAAGRRAVELVRSATGPAAVCSDSSLRNALVVLNAVGGSTNAVLHLAAICGRLGLRFELEDLDRLGRDVPLLADVEPAGWALLPDFDRAGGVPSLLRELGELLDTRAVLADGRSVAEVVATARPAVSLPATGGGRAGGGPAARSALRPAASPLARGGAFRVVRGSLAPDGAVLKRSSCTAGLLRHRGRAVVFHGYDEMRRRVEDPALEVDETSVLVLAGCGPVGGPGMPEWGMIPIPRKLLEAGIEDMVRVTDARMSGTSFGTVALHVAPEAAVGGPLALVRDGDEIELDADAGRLELLVDGATLAERRREWQPPRPDHRRGWPALYAAHVSQAPRGCDLDFLELDGETYHPMVEPVVGRS